MWKVIVVLPFLTACGELTPYERLPTPDRLIGATKLYIEDDVEVWEDLDSLLEGLQRCYNAPSADFWHIPLVILDRETLIQGRTENTIGVYYWYHESVDMPLLKVRRWGGSALTSPIIHELAHRVDHILNPEHGADWDPHNENWDMYFEELHDVAVKANKFQDSHNQPCAE